MDTINTMKVVGALLEEHGIDYDLRCVLGGNQAHNGPRDAFHLEVDGIFVLFPGETTIYLTNICPVSGLVHRKFCGQACKRHTNLADPSWADQVIGFIKELLR